MNKKKSIIISIIIVLLIIILVSSTTYAYLAATTNEEAVDTESGMLGVNYDITPENITDDLVSSLDRERGLKAVAIASLETGSEPTLFNMYINPISLTNLNIEALKWEVEGFSGEEMVYTNSNNFSNAEEGNPIKIVDNYSLLETNTTFNIYIWLDARLINAPINGASFKAKIIADSTPLKGTF